MCCAVLPQHLKWTEGRDVEARERHRGRRWGAAKEVSVMALVCNQVLEVALQITSQGAGGN